MPDKRKKLTMSTENRRQKTCDDLCAARDRALGLCANQGWPKSPVDLELWAATAAIVHACQLWHNIAVVRHKPLPFAGDVDFVGDVEQRRGANTREAKKADGTLRHE